MERPPKFSKVPIFLLMMMLFFNFLSRGAFSPLLPVIEEEFGVQHGRASSLFLLISLSMSLSMIFSGYLAQRMQHRGVILLYEFMMGIALLACALSPSFLALQASVVLLGMSAGLYAPAGLASVTGLVHQKDWGKALGIHEMGPNLGLIAAPLIIGFSVPLLDWRLVLLLIGIGNWLNGLLYYFKGKGGQFPGSPPHFRHLKPIFRNISFWVLTVFLILAASSAMGIYSILPTYLVSDKAMNYQLVNTVVGLSRITGLAFILGAGFLSDKFGTKQLLAYILGISGLFALFLGILDGKLLLAVVFLQPMIISAFFPVINTAISTITEAKTRNVAFSVVIPFASAFGAGATPTLMGIMGEAGLFGLSFILLGGVTLLSLFLLFFLKLPKRNSAAADAAADAT